jgi:hypothetical protein
MNNVQFVIDENGQKVSVIVPIADWNSIEEAKDLFEHLYLSGLIESRKNDPVSCSLNELLNSEGISRDELVR